MSVNIYICEIARQKRPFPNEIDICGVGVGETAWSRLCQNRMRKTGKQKNGAASGGGELAVLQGVCA